MWWFMGSFACIAVAVFFAVRGVRYSKFPPDSRTAQAFRKFRDIQDEEFGV